MSHMSSPARKDWQKSQTRVARRCLESVSGDLYKIPDGALDEVLIEPTVMTLLQEQVMARLAQGIPVTLTYGGKSLYTMYPDGKTEYHPGW